MRASFAFLLVGLVLGVAPARADDADPPRKIVGFDIRGKTKLKVRALKYIADVEEGDFVRERDKPRLVRFLISSELFEQAEVTYEPTAGGITLVATLKDKHSWIVAPTFYVLSGKRSLGAGFVENDLLGLDQKLLAYAQIGERDSLFFGTFLDENLRGTGLTLRLDLYAFRRFIDEYANPVEDATSTDILRTTETNYIGGGLLLGWNLAWWAIADARFRPAYVSFRNPQAPDGSALPAPSIDGWDVTAQARLTLDARANYFGVTWGPYLQILLDQYIPGLDDYHYGSILVRAYYSFKLFGDDCGPSLRDLRGGDPQIGEPAKLSTKNQARCDAHQLEFRTHLNAGYHMPMQEELTLGGVIDLRGYAVDQFRGDTRTMFRAEYSLPIAWWKFFAFRAIGFWDTGYISYQNRHPDGTRNYLAPQVDNASWFRNDVGAGVRIYVRNIVLPLLGLDVAYGIEGRAPEVYFQVGLTDF